MRYARLVSGAVVLSCHSIDLASHSQPHYLYLISTRPFWGLCRFPHTPRHAELQRQLLQDEELLLAREGDEGPHIPPQAGVRCLHHLAPQTLQPPGFSLSRSPIPSPFGLQAPKPFGGFGVKVLPALHRQTAGVSFEQPGAPGVEQLNLRHLAENAPGHVLPAPDSLGFAPLVLLASPQGGKVGGLAGLHARGSSEPPPRMALDAHGGSRRGAAVPPEPVSRSGRGLRLCGAVHGHPNRKSTRGDSVQCDSALSSDPFLGLFDVPFLLALGDV